MNNTSASQFMDKQIMDLSNSQSNINSSSGNNDFIDFMNRPPEMKEDIVPSYDFVPIRPAARSSSPPAARPSDFDSGDDGAPLRTWNSFDSKANASAIRNYSSLDASEPVKSSLEKNHKASNDSDVSLVSEIEKTVKKYVDDLMHAVDGMSARLSQLETKTRNLENSIDDLKVSVGNNHGSTEGRMRLLENILREMQTGMQVIKDKQEIVGAQLQMAKLQVPHVEKQVESQSTSHTRTIQAGASAHPQFSAVPQMQPPRTLPLPNAPPPPPPQLNLQPQIQPPNQFPQNQVPSVPQRESYFSAPGQAPENPTQHYQAPPPQQQHPAPPPPQHQYPPPSQPQYSQPPPPSQPQYSQPPPPSQPQYSQPPPPSQPQYSQPSPPQPRPSFSGINPSQSHHPEETTYMTPQTHSSGINLHPSHHSIGAPSPPQQYYSPASNVYEPPSSRPGPGYSGSLGVSSGHGEPYPPPQYGSGSLVKPQQFPSYMGQSGGSGYPQLPTARILPQALPTASGVSGGSGGSGNRVPIDDVVDRVTNMGFPRDQVRATVQKLTENGQAVDLNIVLDKLMNDGDGQAPRGWLGRL